MPSQMAWAAQPYDQKGLLVIRMMHFRFMRAADFARLRLNYTAFFVDAGMGASAVTLPLPSVHLVDFAPVSHVSGMAIETVAADALVRRSAL